MTDKHGYTATLRLLCDQFSLHLHRHSLLIGVILNSLDALLGQGDDMVRMIVVEWRLQRVLLAILSGAALGMSGAIFQSLTRNPLGSPDIIGFAAGSYTGVMIIMVLLSGGYYEIAPGALTGGILTALAVYALAWRNGMQGFRLIIVGIGISAMLSTFDGWIIKADLNVALTATLTAAAGPIAFIALTGSALLAAADYAAQNAFATQLPVGVMTVSIGGIYFISLLAKEVRS